MALPRPSTNLVSLPWELYEYRLVVPSGNCTVVCRSWLSYKYVVVLLSAFVAVVRGQLNQCELAAA